MRKKNVNHRPGRTASKEMKAAMGPYILMAMPSESLSLSTLSAALTDYFQEHKQGIYSELEIGLFGSDGFSLDRNFTALPGVVDELVLDSATVTDFIHQYVSSSSTTFNPLADAITPDARILKVRDYEGDLQFNDKQIERTHLMWQAKMKMIEASPEATEVQTFVEYLFWDIIMKSAKRTLRKALFQATYDNSAPHAWTKILNGFEKLITDEITATTISPVTTAGVTVSNVIEKIEAVFDTLDVAVKDADDLVCALDTDTYTKFVRADQFTLGRNSSFKEGELKIAGFPNCTIIQEPDMNTTKVAIYRKSNAFVSIGNSQGGDWEFQRQDRVTKMMLNGKMGLQFNTINPGGKVNIAIGR